jgi:sugar phosphate permease
MLKLPRMSEKAKNAFFIALLCSVSYLSVYFARNILSAVSPAMIDTGLFTTEYIGRLSSLYFITYATGQLINGIIGDKISGKYMISLGLILGGVANIFFTQVSITNPNAAVYIYGLTGFFLSMIYAPLTRVIAENTDPIYAPRCSLGYTFSEFFGSPLAGVTAAVLCGLVASLLAKPKEK